MKEVVDNIDFKKINSIEINSYNTNKISLSEDGTKLIINSLINPSIIDNNFNELSDRMTNIESIIKLKINGMLNNLISRVDKIEKR